MIKILGDMESFKKMTNHSATFTMDNCYFNQELFDKLCNVQQPDYMWMEIPTYIQARKNKNKRINKKWLKIYGYKTVMKTVKARVIDIKAEDYPKSYCSNWEISFKPE